MSFNTRISAPNKTSKWWISTASKAGGCNPVPPVTGISVLPDPVGYAHGRFSEILDEGSKLCAGTPGQLYVFIQDGYERGTDPQLGAVACWSGSRDDGHVAVVEKIHPDGSILTSECSYTTRTWKLEVRKPPHYLLKNENGRTFQGFIYNPAVKGTTDQADKFLTTALNQVGSNASWSIKHSGLQANGWSAMFIVACAKQANILDKLIYKTSSCTTLVQMSSSLKMGQWTLKTQRSARPQKCDIIGFRYNTSSSDTDFTCDKLGIVYDISGDIVTCIVGDVSSKVKLVRYNINNTCIKGFYRPKWISVGANILNLIDYKISSEYEIDSTDQDCLMKEVAYLNSNYEPSISPSDIKLCCLNYTDMLADIYDAVESRLTELMSKFQNQGTGFDIANMPGMIGHASKSENGSAYGKIPGDQTGQEVCIRGWYSRSWTCVLRHPVEAVKYRMCKMVHDGCDNDNIGYDQNTRNTLHKRAIEVHYDLTKIVTPCATDCSAFMTVCAIGGGVSGLEYSGNAPTTSTMTNAFANAGFQVLKDSKYLTSPDYLEPGDILVAAGHHTVMCLGYGKKTSGYSKTRLVVGGGTTGGQKPPIVTGNAKMVVDFCMSKGLNFAASCAVAANIKHESGFRTDAVGDNGTSFGLCQWHLGRGESMKKFVGPNWANDFTGQLEFLWNELTHLPYRNSVYGVITAVPDDYNGLIQATDRWIRSYEVPAGYDDPSSKVYTTRRATATLIYTGEFKQ